SPAWFAQPRITSSTAAQSSCGSRSTSAWIGSAARSSVRTLASAPPWRPNGVRSAAQRRVIEVGEDGRPRRVFESSGRVERPSLTARAGETPMVSRMSFKLTYATMFDPPEELHVRFEAALAGLRTRLGAEHALHVGGED